MPPILQINPHAHPYQIARLLKENVPTDKLRELTYLLEHGHDGVKERLQKCLESQLSS